MGEPALHAYAYPDYLEFLASSDEKYEYHDGTLVSMAGGSPAHGQIAANFLGEVHNHLKAQAQACSMFNSDVKVRIEAVNCAYYPDASVVCGPTEVSPHDANAITNPRLILEVLSDSTAAFDRGPKFSDYRLLPSLKEYVLAAQHAPLIDTYYRTEDGTWDIKTYKSLNESLYLASIGHTLRMADMYRLVFPD